MFVFVNTRSPVFALTEVGGGLVASRWSDGSDDLSRTSTVGRSFRIAMSAPLTPGLFGPGYGVWVCWGARGGPVGQRGQLTGVNRTQQA